MPTPPPQKKRRQGYVIFKILPSLTVKCILLEIKANWRSNKSCCTRHGLLHQTSKWWGIWGGVDKLRPDRKRSVTRSDKHNGICPSFLHQHTSLIRLTLLSFDAVTLLRSWSNIMSSLLWMKHCSVSWWTWSGQNLSTKTFLWWGLAVRTLLWNSWRSIFWTCGSMGRGQFAWPQNSWKGYGWEVLCTWNESSQDNHSSHMETALASAADLYRNWAWRPQERAALGGIQLFHRRSVFTVVMWRICCHERQFPGGHQDQLKLQVLVDVHWDDRCLADVHTGTARWQLASPPASLQEYAAVLLLVQSDKLRPLGSNLPEWDEPTSWGGQGRVQGWKLCRQTLSTPLQSSGTRPKSGMAQWSW